MPECGYCDESFDDEAAYLDHLRTAHEGELGPIDRRRVAPEDGGGLPMGPLALGVVLLTAAAVVGYVIFLPGGGGGGSGSGGPTDLGAVHYHGSMRLVIDGDRVDFSQSKYQLQSDPFHFEGGDGERWHVHARNVTLGWAMDSLGIPVSAGTVRFDGTTYDDADPGTNVTITVDGEPVRPHRYVLQQGDRVRIVVELA